MPLRQPKSTLFPYTTLFRSLLGLVIELCRRSTGWGLTTLVAVLLIFTRSEEHTSELQSRLHLVCRLLLEKKNLPRFAWSTPQRQKLKFLPLQRYNLTLNLL